MASGSPLGCGLDARVEGTDFEVFLGTVEHPSLRTLESYINLKVTIHFLLNKMMNLSFWDHAYVFAVIVVFPIYSKFTIKSVLDDIHKNGEPARIRAYQHVILTWIAFTTYVLLMWWGMDRSWADLGIRGADPVRITIGLAIAASVVALVVLQLRGIYLSGERHNELDTQLGNIGILMPRSRKEGIWFKGVSTNAGLSEELIFRGYLIWYLQHFAGLWWAAAIAVAAFGLAHSYQGLKQLPGIFFISAVAVALYVFTSSLLVPIVFHITLDAIQGHYIVKIRQAQTAVS